MPIRLIAGFALACAGFPAVHAATLSYSGIAEKVSSDDTFAIAGGNGSGPNGSETRNGSSLSFSQRIITSLEDHNDDDNSLATAFSLANQETVLTSTSMDSSGQVTAGVSVAFAGAARAEGLSSFETSFSVDADVGFSFGIGVSCAEPECQSSVSLFGPNGALLIGRSVTSGIASGSFQGTLLAGQTYRITASTHDFLWLTSPSPTEGSGGAYSFQLLMTNNPGGMVPEPASVALLSVGLGVVAWRGRKTLRSRA